MPHSFLLGGSDAFYQMTATASEPGASVIGSQRRDTEPRLIDINQGGKKWI
jgi:hypothetical protein